MTNGGILELAKRTRLRRVILKSLYTGIVVFIVVYIIGIFIQESNFKTIIMALIVGLTAMVTNLIIKNKHR